MGWKKRSRRLRELPKDWKHIRRTVLDRDGEQCVFCGMPATDVDHIDPRGPHEPGNLRSLCHHCHMARTARQSHERRHQNKSKPFQYKNSGRPHRPSSGHPGLIE